jgi:predicted AlkP superfamily phosphohydrolase/phosphomutase
MAANTKVLIIGADSMEKDLMLHWMREGAMPNFKALQERSVWGLSANPPRRYSGAVWPSFYTGVEPDKHNQYIHTKFDPQTYEFEGVRPREDGHLPFWTNGAMADKRIGIVNMPYAPLSPSINGFQTSEWGVHDAYAEDGRDKNFQSHPPELKQAVLKKYGGDPVGNPEVSNRSPKEFIDFSNRLVERIENKTRMICDSLNEGGWDLFMTVFDECHTVSHQCWHMYDTNHPLHENVDKSIGDPNRDVFVALDTALGRIVECAGEDAYVLFLASHGMGSLFVGNRILDDVLRQFEQSKASGGVGLLGILSRTWNALPSGVRGLLRPLRARFGPQIFQSLTSGDRSSRKCFAIPTQDQCGGVRINLAGRESQGIVDPGPEFDAYTDELIGKLYGLIDDRTGEPAIRDIMRSAELDQGNHLGDAADLILQWRNPAVTSLSSPDIDTVDAVYGSRSGDHKPWGMYFACGPDVSPGEFDEAIYVTDYAPTIAKILGVDLSGTDGSVAPRLCPKGTV